VIIAEPDDAEVLVAQVRSLAMVVIEPPDGPVSKAFAVQGFPALAIVEDGTVTASGSELDAFPALTQA
jgi:hypothetical protein